VSSAGLCAIISEGTGTPDAKGMCVWVALGKKPRKRRGATKEKLTSSDSTSKNMMGCAGAGTREAVWCQVTTKRSEGSGTRINAPMNAPLGSHEKLSRWWVTHTIKRPQDGDVSSKWGAQFGPGPGTGVVTRSNCGATNSCKTSVSNVTKADVDTHKGVVHVVHCCRAPMKKHTSTG